MGMSRAAFPAFVLSVLLASLPAPAWGAGEASDADGSNIRISIITIGPGSAAYERFGHIALRIQDPDARYPDVAFNWGVFDFAQKNFFVNFIQGRMTYSTGWDPDGPGMIQAYRDTGRAVWEQDLNLTPSQKLDLADRCYRAIQPAHRDYLYDYYLNNCSTQVRDRLDAVVGGAISRQTQGVATSTTFRWHTRRATADELWLYTSLTTLLGHPADRPIDAWEEMFLPSKLREHLRDIQIADERGQRVPLIKSEQLLSAGTKPPERTRAPNFVPGFLAAGVPSGLLLLALSLAFAGTAATSPSQFWRILARRVGRWLFFLFSTAWLMLISVGGISVAWSWFFTDHHVAVRNENLLQLTPLALPLIYLLPRLAWKRRGARWALILSVSMAALSILGLVLKVFTAFNQVNGDIIAFVLPVQLAFAWIVWRLASRPQVPAAAVRSSDSLRRQTTVP